jgi:AraC-like DNA-binding protein
MFWAAFAFSWLPHLLLFGLLCSQNRSDQPEKEYLLRAERPCNTKGDAGMKDSHSQNDAAELPAHWRRNQEKSFAISGHETRSSESAFVEQIGHICAEREHTPLCPADGHWNMLLVRYRGETSLSVWGPMTKAATMPYREGAEFLYITFTLGTFLPQMPVGHLLDKGEFLPLATGTSFWLGDSSWQFPDYEHADAFVDKLVRKGLLIHEPVVDAALQDQSQAMSLRSTQRHFLRATGLPLRSLQTIERARYAAALLQQGVSLLDTVEEAGYFDQPHLTRALKRFIGQTPAQIAQMGKS